MEWFAKNDHTTPKELIDEVHASTDNLDLSRRDTFAYEHKACRQELEEERLVLQRGRSVFYRHFPAALLSMLFAGLAGGFASPRIMTVLQATGYLVTADTDAARRASDRLNRLRAVTSSDLHSMFLSQEEETAESAPLSDAAKERTFKRLLETLQFILDIMGTDDALSSPSAKAESMSGDPYNVDQGGLGWAAATRVRFLHARVRQRIMQGKDADAFSATCGVPINQEDLMATLGSFCVAPLWSLQRVGIPLTAREKEDFVALWRHVGFYMGIEPRILRRCFRDYEAAERFYFCVSSHHFLGVDIPSRVQLTALTDAMKSGRDLRGPALPLLYSAANRAPVPLSFATNCAVTRFLLGDSLANALFLPRTSPKRRIRLAFVLAALAAPSILFDCYWRSGWKQEAENCLRIYLQQCTEHAIAKQTKQAVPHRATFDFKHGTTPVKHDAGSLTVRIWKLALELAASISLVISLPFLLGALAHYIT